MELIKLKAVGTGEGEAPERYFWQSFRCEFLPLRSGQLHGAFLLPESPFNIVYISIYLCIRAFVHFAFFIDSHGKHHKTGRPSNENKVCLKLDISALFISF